MVLRNILFFILLLSLFIETTFISFPLFFITAVLIFILFPDNVSVFVIFLLSLILDSIKLSPLASTALLLSFSFLILEGVKRVFDTRDFKLILVFLFISSFIYAKFASYNPGILSYAFIYILSGVIFYYFFIRKALWLR